MDLKTIQIEKIDLANQDFNFRFNISSNGLGESINNEGLIQPVVLKEISADDYIVVSGHRRVHAFKENNKFDIDAIVFDNTEKTDDQLLKIAIAENTKRQNLEPVEIAKALKQLQEKMKLTTKELALQYGTIFGIGSSEKKVENYLKLNLLNENIKDKINSGLLKPDVGFEIGKIDEKPDRDEIESLISHCDGINKKNVNSIIENAKKLKIDQEMDSFKEVFEKRGLDSVIKSDDFPNRVDAFVQQLNREANPEKVKVQELIEQKIEEIYQLCKTEADNFKGKLQIKKKDPAKKGININMTISSNDDLIALIKLLQGNGGEILREIIEPSKERVMMQ